MTGAPFPRGLLEERARARRTTNDHLEAYFHNFPQRETAVAIVPGNAELSPEMGNFIKEKLWWLMSPKQLQGSSANRCLILILWNHIHQNSNSLGIKTNRRRKIQTSSPLGVRKPPSKEGNIRTFYALSKTKRSHSEAARNGTTRTHRNTAQHQRTTKHHNT